MRRQEASFASPMSIAVAMQLGEAIRLARLSRNLTQVDFAERARISVSTLQRIERGAPAVSFTSWLSAMEAGSLLPLLQVAADPDADVLGKARRQLERWSRASRPGTITTEADAYDF